MPVTCITLYRTLRTNSILRMGPQCPVWGRKINTGCFECPSWEDSSLRCIRAWRRTTLQGTEMRVSTVPGAGVDADPP